MIDEPQSESDKPEHSEARSENSSQAEKKNSARVQGIRLHLAQISESITALRSMLANLLLLVVIVSLIMLLAWELTRDTVLLEPLKVPNGIAEQGYTGDILALRLIDELAIIRETAHTRKKDLSPEISPKWSQIDVQIPGFGLSFRSVIHYIGDFHHVNGEITTRGAELHLRLRESRYGALPDINVDSPDEIEKLVNLGARQIMRVLDPYVLAAYLNEIEEFEAAIEAIGYCIANPPKDDDAWAYNLWGNIHRDKEQYDIAEAKYAKAISHDKEFFLVYGDWGMSLSQQGRYEEALQKLYTARELAPKDVYIIGSLGETLTELKKFDESIALFESNSLGNESSAFFINEWARTLHAMGDWERARQKFERVTELFPKEAVSHSNLGDTLRRLKRFKEAELHLNRAIELDPEYGPAHFNLGMLHDDRGQYEKAVAAVEAALASKLSPQARRLAEETLREMQSDYR